MHTIILITSQKELLIGRAQCVIFEKNIWKKGILKITNAWLTSARIGNIKWEKEITPFFGPPKRYMDLIEKVSSHRRHKHCTVYQLENSEILIVYDKPPNSSYSE